MEIEDLKNKLDEPQTKEFLISLGAVGASFLLKKLLEAGYEKIYNEDPPNEVDDREINWGKLAGWTIVSGISAMALKVFIKRLGGKLSSD